MNTCTTHLLSTTPAFPERAPSKPAEQQGMFRKFDVRRVDGNDQPGDKHYGCRYYVLDLTHDQHAPVAMRAYATACASTHPNLAADIEAEFGVQTVPADAMDALESQIIKHRIAITPEYEGGWLAEIYGDEEAPTARGEGKTPSEAVSMALKHTPASQKGSGK
jgi:hypothetical protein